MEAKYLQPGSRFRKPGTDLPFSTVMQTGTYGNPKKNIMFVECVEGHNFFFGKSEELEIGKRDICEINVEFETVQP